MCGIHDVRPSSLSQIVELAHHGPIIEVKVECRFFLENMQMQRYLGWNRLGLGVLDPNIPNDRVNQSLLGEFIRTVSKFLDIDAHIVHWMALILNIESQSLHLFKCLLKLGVVVAQEDAIVHKDHENDVTTKEDTVRDQ